MNGLQRGIMHNAQVQRNLTVPVIVGSTTDLAVRLAGERLIATLIG
jgi:hypothetical protein